MPGVSLTRFHGHRVHSEIQRPCRQIVVSRLMASFPPETRSSAGNATERFVCYRTDRPSHVVARSSRMVHDRVTLCQVFTMFKHRLESYQSLPPKISAKSRATQSPLEPRSSSLRFFSAWTCRKLRPVTPPSHHPMPSAKQNGLCPIAGSLPK